MEESLKKLVYAGVGFAAQASEKFEKSIEELVKKGNIEEKEGKKIVNDFFAKSEKTKERVPAGKKMGVDKRTTSGFKVKPTKASVKTSTAPDAAMAKRGGGPKGQRVRGEEKQVSQERCTSGSLGCGRYMEEKEPRQEGS